MEGELKGSRGDVKSMNDEVALQEGGALYTAPSRLLIIHNERCKRFKAGMRTRLPDHQPRPTPHQRRTK